MNWLWSLEMNVSKKEHWRCAIKSLATHSNSPFPLCDITKTQPRLLSGAKEQVPANRQLGERMGENWDVVSYATFPLLWRLSLKFNLESWCVRLSCHVGCKRTRQLLKRGACVRESEIKLSFSNSDSFLLGSSMCFTAADNRKLNLTKETLKSPWARSKAANWVFCEGREKAN